MTEPRKTPRTDGQRLQWNRFQGFVASKFGNVVTSDFARALEIETQELAEALRDMRDACKGEPAMNHQKYDALGIRVNNLLARAESATPAKHPDAEPEVIGGYEGEGGRRFWWTGGTWLYPGQEVAVISARKQEAAR